MFNLWCSACEDYDREKNAVKDSARKYTVDEIFSSSLVVWYFEAVKQSAFGGCFVTKFDKKKSEAKKCYGSM